MSKKKKKNQIPRKERKLTSFLLSRQFGQHKGDGKSGVIGSLSNIFSMLMDRIKWVHLQIKHIHWQGQHTGVDVMMAS